MVVKMHCLIWLLRGIYIKENLYLGLLFSDLYSETVPGSSPAAAYVQRWALCSNRPAYVQVSVKRVEVVERTQRNSLPLTQLPCKLWMFVKENMDRKKKVPYLRLCLVNMNFPGTECQGKCPNPSNGRCAPPPPKPSRNQVNCSRKIEASTQK